MTGKYILKGKPAKVMPFDHAVIDISDALNNMEIKLSPYFADANLKVIKNIHKKYPFIRIRMSHLYGKMKLRKQEPSDGVLPDMVEQWGIETDKERTRLGLD